MPSKDFECRLPDSTGTSDHHLKVTQPSASDPGVVTLYLSEKESAELRHTVVMEYEKLARMLNRPVEKTIDDTRISIHTGEHFDPALGVIMVSGLVGHGMAPASTKETLVQRLAEEGHVPK
jgi:hypothetical protein